MSETPPVPGDAAAALPAELAELIEDVTEVPATDITSDTRFDGLGSWSSLAALRLHTKIEDSMGVWLDLHSYLGMKTVGELGEAVRRATP
jgi:acyl carrier protein